jgi:hypothetical protein
MDGDANARMFFQQVQKREIGVGVALLKNMFEIAGGLMGVNDENEVERLAGLGHICHIP